MADGQTDERPDSQMEWTEDGTSGKTNGDAIAKSIRWENEVDVDQTVRSRGRLFNGNGDPISIAVGQHNEACFHDEWARAILLDGKTRYSRSRLQINGTCHS